MLEEILDYERGAFLALNGSSSGLLDRFMWIYSGRAVWIPVAILIAAILLYKRGWKESLFIIIAIALVVTLCDQFASGVCKPMFTRFRPTHHPEFMNEVHTVFGYRGGRYGFISSHAANAFGFATFMALLFRSYFFSSIVFLWAVVTAYSRIYLGVHFISDVVPGILIGMLFGWFVYRLYKKTRLVVLSRSGGATDSSLVMYSCRQKQVAAYGIIATVLVILLFNVTISSLLR